MGYLLNTSIVGYFKNRWKIITGILVLICFLAVAGIAFAVVPVIGFPIFAVTLYIWYVPGVLFDWTGFFTFNEFGANPNGLAGYIIMFLFYVVVAAVLAAPFGGKKHRPADKYKHQS